MFNVKQGTAIKVHEDKPGYSPSYDVEDRNLKRDLIFGVEDICIDPVGRVGCHRGMTNVIGGAWAEAGFYGFTFRNFTILVPATSVEVM